MSRGTNSWNGSGNVAGELLFSQTTGKGEKAASFKIACEQAHKTTVFVRINVYGGNVDVLRERGVKKGDFVIITGELMNRRGQSDMLTEVRCSQIVIPRLGKEEDYGQAAEENR